MGTLSRADKIEMKKAGFLSIEIKQLDNARNPDGKFQHVNIHNSAWQGVLRSRRKYIKDMRDAKLTDAQIIKLIVDYHKTRTHSIFDFLQVEGSPTQRKQRNEAEVMRRFKAKKKVARKFGRRYGRPVYPRKFPKSITELPIIPSS